MANKSINSLVNASGLDNDDLLVLWDSGTNTAQNLSGAQFSAWLVSLANGHGGIEDFEVVDSGTAGDGRLHTATLTYAGDHSTYTFSFMDGYKGDTGPQTYVFLKYADHEPTSDADMGDTPDSWIGIYVGTAIDDPSDLHYTDLVWYEWKGPKGDGVSYTAQTGTVGLTRTYTMYTADGTAVGSFSVTDGEGAVSTVNGIAPDGDGDVLAVVTSVEDLGLTSGSATIADAYDALQVSQILFAPAADFAIGELPLVGGSRLTNGTVEIIKATSDGSRGRINFYGKSDVHGDFRMFLDLSNNAPSGTWIPVSSSLLTTTPSISNGTYESTSYGIYKSGSLVTVGIITNGTTVTNSWATIGTIPAGYIPSREVSGIGLSGYTPIQVKVLTTGAIQYRNTSALSANTTRFNLTWMI